MNRFIKIFGKAFLALVVCFVLISCGGGGSGGGDNTVIEESNDGDVDGSIDGSVDGDGDTDTDTDTGSYGKPITVNTKINDTGVDWCSDWDNPELDCPQEAAPNQDAEHGRDFLARKGVLNKYGSGAAGFDFTKISNSGNDLPASAELGSGPNDWACTRDNVTGLIWEVKVDDSASLRHRDNTYTSFVSNSKYPDGFGTLDGGECIGSACDTVGYIETLNTATLCGLDNWRMPEKLELMGIVHNGVQGARVDLEFFPNTIPASYWTASILGFYVGFNSGTVGILNKDTPLYVRAVSGTIDNNSGAPYNCKQVNSIQFPTTPTSDFIINDDGTAVHKKTSLMWMREDIGKLNWAYALRKAASYEYAGYDDWRLPTKNELASIVEDTCPSTGLNEEVFNVDSQSDEAYWTSTPYYSSVNPGPAAWAVFFGSDIIGGYYNTISNNALVRLVRDVEPVYVTDITVLPKDGAASVTWPAIDNADGYNIYVSTQADIQIGNGSNYLSKITTSNTEIIIDDLVNEAVYYVGVTAILSGKESPLLKTWPVKPQKVIYGRYLPSEDGHNIQDVETGLDWKRCSYGQTWNGFDCLSEVSFIDYETVTTLDTENSYRIATFCELQTLVYCSSGQPVEIDLSLQTEKPFSCLNNTVMPAIYPFAFPSSSATAYWSATGIEHIKNSTREAGEYDTVSFLRGSLYSNDQGDSIPVRFVRGAAPVRYLDLQANDGQISLYWTDCSVSDSFDVFISKQSDIDPDNPATYFENIQTSEPDIQVDNLEPDTTYYFSVIAVLGGERSPMSEIVSINTGDF